MVSISVITAVYDRRQTVSQALESVFAQSHPATESVIIDGGSTDGTLEAIEPYRTRAGVFVSEPDQGIYDALNKGIRRSSGDVVGFLHADDLFADRHVLSRVAEAFDQDASVGAVYGDLVYVRQEDVHRVVRYWKAGPYDRNALRRGWMPPHPTFYVRRRVYEELGLFDTRYRISADYDSILRFLVTANFRATYIPHTMVRMRVGGASNKSLQNILQKSREDLRAIKSNRIGGVGTLLQKNLRKVHQFWER